jgi:PAS domain S-box-containing protein
MEQLYENSLAARRASAAPDCESLLRAWQISGCAISLIGPGPDSHPFLWVSDEFCRLLAASEESILAAEFGRFQDADRSQPGLVSLQEALRRGITQEATLRTRRVNGELFVEEVRLTPLRNPAGRIEYFVCSHRDITPRHRQIQSLSRAKEALDDLLITTGAVLWDADAESMHFHHISATAVDLLGHPLDTWLTQPGFWESILHPEDAELALPFRKRMAARGRPHELDYRLRHADGRWIAVRDDVRGFFEDAGTLCMRGTLVPVRESQSAPAPTLVPAPPPADTPEKNLERFLAATAAAGKVRSWAFVTLARRPFLLARYSICGLQRLQAAYDAHILQQLPKNTTHYILEDAGILFPIGDGRGFIPAESVLKDKAHRSHNTTLTFEQRSAMLCLNGHVESIPFPPNQSPESAAAAIADFRSRMAQLDHTLHALHA